MTPRPLHELEVIQSRYSIAYNDHNNDDNGGGGIILHWSWFQLNYENALVIIEDMDMFGVTLTKY